MLMNLLSINNCCIYSLACIVQYDNTAALASHILHGFVQHPLKHSAKIQGGGYFAADIIEKFKEGFGTILFLR
jgi:hypothetical protein